MDCIIKQHRQHSPRIPSQSAHPQTQSLSLSQYCSRKVEIQIQTSHCRWGSTSARSSFTTSTVSKSSVKLQQEMHAYVPGPQPVGISTSTALLSNNSMCSRSIASDSDSCNSVNSEVAHIIVLSPSASALSGSELCSWLSGATTRPWQRPWPEPWSRQGLNMSSSYSISELEPKLSFPMPSLQSIFANCCKLNGWVVSVESKDSDYAFDIRLKRHDVKIWYLINSSWE